MQAGEPSPPEDAPLPVPALSVPARSLPPLSVPPPSPVRLVDASLASSGADASSAGESLPLASEGAAAPSAAKVPWEPPHATMATPPNTQGRWFGVRTAQSLSCARVLGKENVSLQLAWHRTLRVDQRPGWAGAQCIAVHGTGIEPRQTVRYSKGTSGNRKSYQENITASCGITSSGEYAAKHNPFVFFRDVVGSYSSPSSFCTSHIVDYSNLATDLVNNNLADFIEITPNLCDDGHDCSNPSVETFLQSSTIQALISYVGTPSNHAILVIDWDESESTSMHPMLLIAPPSTLVGTHNVTTQVDHSSFVRSMQRIFGVDPSHADPTTGHAFSWLRSASSASDFSTFFAPGQFP